MPKAIVQEVEAPPTRPPQSHTSSRLSRLLHWWGEDRTVTLSRRIGGTGLMLSSFYAIGGPGAALTVATLIAAIWGAKPLIARWPEQLGSLVSFAATWALAMLFSGVMGPDLAMAGSHDLGAGFAIGAFLLTVLVWVAPAGNCHRGWSTFIGLAPINVGMFIAAAWPQHSGVTSLIAASLGCVLIFLRLRHHAGQATQNEDARKKRRIRTIAAGIVGGILLISVAAVATPPKANAMFGIFDDKLCSMMSPETTQEPIGTGPESWFPPKNFAQIPAEQTQEGVPNPPPYLDTPLKMEGDLDKYTLFEVAGLRGLRFVNWTHTASGGYDCSFGAFMSVNSGNSINTLSRAILQAVIALKEYSQTKNPFAALYAQFSPMLDVFITIAMSAFGLLYMVSLIVLLFKLVKGGSLQTHGGKLMGGLLAAFLFGVVYNGSILTASMENPNGSLFYEVMSDADSFVGTLNAAVASEVLDGIPDAESSMCRKPEGGTNSVEDGQRYSSCLMAEVIAYRPWAKAQFGISGERQIEPNVKPVEGASNSKDGDPKALPCYNNYNGCSDIRSYLIAQAGGPSYIEDYETCLSSNGYDLPKPDDDADPPEIDQLRVCDPYYAVAEDFFQKQRTDKTKTQGTEMLLSYTGRSGGHASSAFFGLVAAVVVGGIIAVIAAATLMAHFQLLWLFLTGPFYFLGAMLRGFEVVNKWGAQVIQTFILRMFYGFAVTGIILAISIIAVLDVSSGFRMLLLGLMVASVIKGLRKLDAMTAFGGAEPAGFSSTGMKVGAAAAGVVGYKGGTAAARSAVRAAPRVGNAVAGAAGAAAGKVLPTKTIGKGVDFINNAEKTGKNIVATTGRAGKNIVASKAGSVAGAVVPVKGAGAVSRDTDAVKPKSSAESEKAETLSEKAKKVSKKVSEVANQKAPFKSSYAAARASRQEAREERVNQSSGDSGSTAKRVASSQGTQAQRRRSRSTDNFDDPTGTLGGGASSQRERRQNRRGQRENASRFSNEDKANRLHGAKNRDSKPSEPAQGSRHVEESRPQRPQRNEPRPVRDRVRQVRRSSRDKTSGRPPFNGNDKSE